MGAEERESICCLSEDKVEKYILAKQGYIRRLNEEHLLNAEIF